MFKDLVIGNGYSKIDLVDIISEPTLKSSREGIFNCKYSTNTLFFVTLDKSSKNESLHYNDYFEEDFFIGIPKINNTLIHLEYKK